MMDEEMDRIEYRAYQHQWWWLCFMAFLFYVVLAIILGVIAWFAISTAHAEEGVATWYGKGKRVACGGPFRPMAMEAAHKTLPCGSRVRVTRRDNGKSVVVTIRDRGPYGAGKIIDLNLGAAKVLGIVRSGIARVTVRRI